MTIDVNFAVLAVLLSGLAVLASWLTYSRAGDWRQSDAGKETSAKLSAHAERLTKLETRLENLATKADIAEVKGQMGTIKAELDGVRSDARAAATGVERIEEFLMEASKP
jgi:hypothetical protein